MKELTPELELLKKHIQRCNPIFTENSLKRTIEIIIIEIKELFFMAKIEDSEIQSVLNSIPTEWNIQDRIRN